MKLKKITILIFILILIIPVSTFGLTAQDNGKIKIEPVVHKNFEAKWLKGFDIKGYITKEDNKKEIISTTHNNLGYHVFLNVNGKYGEMNGKYTKGKEAMEAMHYKEVQNDTTQNVAGVNLTIKTKYLNNGEQIQIIYTLKNITQDDAKISLGTSADIEIDGDDKATLEKLRDGEEIRLITNQGKTKKKVQFILYAKNAKEVTNVDNMWIGNWSDYYLMNIFNSNPSITKIENQDSALSFSWVNREIKSGETKNYSVVMEVGELNKPNIEIPIKNDTYTENPPKDINTNIIEELPNIKNENTSNSNTTIKETAEDTNSKKLEKDTTVASIKIPQTGENNNWILLAIMILGLIAIKSYIKLKNIK